MILVNTQSATTKRKVNMMGSYYTVEAGRFKQNQSRSDKQPGIWFAFFFLGCLMCLLYSSSVPAAAQPSGGPYGPIRLTYKAPASAKTVYYVAPDGQAGETGLTLSKPTTLESAVERVGTGDAIVMRGGTYRTGQLLLNQGVTIQPYADEQPVLKGTLVATKWENLRNGLWTTSWSRLFPSKPDSWWRRSREGKKTPLYRFNNDMVFVNGRFLQAVGWEGDVDENSYYIDYDAGLVYIGVDPTDLVVEITAFSSAIIRTTGEVHGKKSDRKGYVIRGITFTQYAYRALEIEGTEPDGPSPEAAHGKEVVGTTLEHCTISYCSRVAGYLRGDRMTIRHCRVSDTSTEGIYLIASNDCLLEKNIFTRNNIEGITGYYPAAVKIFNQCYRVTCRDNLVTDLPNSNGIWYDVGNVDGRFLNNWVEKVGRKDQPFSKDQPWPSDNGFFFEISKGAVCAGNVFVNCDHGLWILNSSNALVYHNTFINSTACIGRTERSAVGDHFGWHPSTGPGVEERDGHVMVGNLFTGDAGFNRPLLFVWQSAPLCGRLGKPQLREMDHNVYVRGTGTAAIPFILWSPAPGEKCRSEFTSLEDLRKMLPEFSPHDGAYFADDGPLFKGRELGHYQLLAGFPGLKSAAGIPADIRNLMGQAGKIGPYVGAYPPVPYTTKP
jgi:parallel beta-helix repeat protein